GLALTIRVKASLFDANVVSDEQQLLIPVVLMDDHAAKTSGRTHDITRHGRVVDSSGRAMHAALVEVLDEKDALLDWSHTNGDGVFAIAVPQAGMYRTVVSAPGWHPESAFIDFTAEDGTPEIRLSRSVEQTLG
ncbi:MAG TPA: hypothetical protein DDY88_02980, partial [Actinobacteria bacterium]|nr:hypothetical protein [Actinomycetota bacterium]